MHDGLDLQTELMVALDEAEARINEMASLGEAKAEAERAYRVAKRKRLLMERQQGTPVSIIADIVKGYEDIAQLALERDCAEAVYEANREAIMFAKHKSAALREIIAREYGRE